MTPEQVKELVKRLLETKSELNVSTRLVDRLRGQYASGPHLPNGKPEFGWRQFEAPPIQHEAAGVIEQLASALSLLSEEREELMADKDRLDFLDSLNAALNKRYGTNYSWTLIFNHNVTRLMLGGHLVVDLNDAEARGLPSCRNAIDVKRREVAARAALKEGS